MLGNVQILRQSLQAVSSPHIVGQCAAPLIPPYLQASCCIIRALWLRHTFLQVILQDSTFDLGLRCLLFCSNLKPYQPGACCQLLGCVRSFHLTEPQKVCYATLGLFIAIDVQQVFHQPHLFGPLHMSRCASSL